MQSPCELHGVAPSCQGPHELHGVAPSCKVLLAIPITHSQYAPGVLAELCLFLGVLMTLYDIIVYE